MDYERYQKQIVLPKIGEFGQKKICDSSVLIIGVGGINSASDAIEKIKAGADLLQIYSGFIYEGPSLVKNINKSLINL